MLLDETVDFCDQMYSSFGCNCGCEGGVCNHPSDRCSGSCYNCLYQVHYPDRWEGKKRKVYDCPKMLYHYVCQYSYLYSTELLCAFGYEWDFIKGFPYYNILSLGCGGCADLMAFDFLRIKKKNFMPVSYFGVDVNYLWERIHRKIYDYCGKNDIKFQALYYDAFDYFKYCDLKKCNIIVISYLISFLYNTNQIIQLKEFTTNLVENVIKHKEPNMPLLLIINDVNSCNRGRNYFQFFIDAIQRYGLTIRKSEYKYFDTGNLCDGQKCGSPYNLNSVPFCIPVEIQRKYHACTSINSTVQLLLEVS